MRSAISSQICCACPSMQLSESSKQQSTAGVDVVAALNSITCMQCIDVVYCYRWHMYVHCKLNKDATILLNITTPNAEWLCIFFCRNARQQICNKIINKNSPNTMLHYSKKFQALLWLKMLLFCRHSVPSKQYNQRQHTEQWIIIIEQLYG